MNTMPNYNELWPDLFNGLTPEETSQYLSDLAVHWLEGFEPTREFIKDDIALFKGEITIEESTRRIMNPLPIPSRP